MFKTNFFEANLKAMGGGAYAELKKELEGLKTLHFDFEFDPFDTLNTNIKDKKTNEKIYNEPLKELNATLEPFKKEFQRYPVLFFYGIGNGVLYKALAQNATHKRIVVFEPSVELIYMALNLMDFTQEISQGRVIIVWTRDYSVAIANKFFSTTEFKLSARLYDLHINSDYYDKNFNDDIKKTNDINIKAILSYKIMAGNDPKDALMGIRQYLINLPKMISHPKFVDLKRKHTKKTNYAILVATGPSLTKQLPLLKKVAKKATIFCADSSYKFLQKEGIKPDYVLSLERGPKTSEFFNNDFGDYDNGIIFLIFALTNPNTIEYLEKNNRDYVLTQRTLHFARYLNLTDYGFMSGGMSVMNMAYQFAESLSYKKIVFIGQDLSYSDDGKSHPKGYQYAYFDEEKLKAQEKLPKITAYGGQGEVISNEIWVIFKEIFEGYIFANKKHIKTYNCTEGGARIEGTIEKPFKEICEILAKQKDKPKFAKIKKPTKKQSGETMLKAYKMIKDGQKFTANFIRQAKRVQKQLNGLVRGKQKYTLAKINENLDKIKHKITSKKGIFFGEILSPSLSHQEAILAPLYAKNFENETDRQNKLLMWLYAHEAWLEEVIDLLEVFSQTIRDNIVPLREELEKRKLI